MLSATSLSAIANRPLSQRAEQKQAAKRLMRSRKTCKRWVQRTCSPQLVSNTVRVLRPCCSSQLKMYPSLPPLPYTADRQKRLSGWLRPAASTPDTETLPVSRQVSVLHQTRVLAPETSSKLGFVVPTDSTDMKTERSL